MCKASILFILLLSVLSFAQTGTIAGRIIDGATGTPLTNVNIKVAGTAIGAMTDADGRYTIKGLEFGRYDIVFSYIGYKPQTVKNFDVGADIATLDIELLPMPIEAGEIVVTATRRLALLENTPEITMVIPEHELALTSPQDVSEAVAYMPGVSVEGGTGSGQPFKRMISIDGLPPQYCIVLMNGARVVSSHYHTGADVNIVPPEAIERIELVKGAASAQYGSDGMGGILNIITKKGTESPEVLFTTYGGSRNTFHTSLAIHGKVNDNVKHSVFSSWEQSDGPPILEPTFRVNQLDYSLFHLLDRIDAKIGKLSLGTQMFYLASAYPFKGDEPYDSWLITPKLDLNYSVSKELEFSTSAYYTQWNSERNSEINEVAEPEICLGYSGLKNNYLLIGGEYIYRNFRRKAVDEHNQTTLSAFIQDEWTPFEKLSLLGAVRFDKVEEIDGVITPKLTIMYKPFDMLKVRTSVGRGFRAPSIQDLYETIYGHGTHLRAGNPELEPEYSTGITGGIEIEPIGGLSLMLNGYYTALTDMITPIDHGLESVFDYFTPEELPDWDPEDTTLYYIYRRENIHKATIYGGEMKILWNLSDNYYVESAFNYTYNRNEDTDESLPYYPGIAVSGKIYGEQPVTGWLEIGGFIGVNATMDRKIWKFKHDGQQQVELDDYQKLDAGLNIKLNKRYEFFATIDNILGQEIHTYEDVEMRIEGIPIYNAGIRIMAF